MAGAGLSEAKEAPGLPGIPGEVSDWNVQGTGTSRVQESHCTGGLTPHRSPVFCVQRDDVATVARRLSSMAAAAMARGVNAARVA